MEGKDESRENKARARARRAATTIESGWAAVSNVLDGVAERRAYGFAAITDERVLHVPHTKATDAAQAIVLCRKDGVLRSKLANMPPDAADYLYFTTITGPELEN